MDALLHIRDSPVFDAALVSARQARRARMHELVLLVELPEERRADPDVRAVAELLAEYRVALFAQPMRTSVPVSGRVSSPPLAMARVAPSGIRHRR